MIKQLIASTTLAILFWRVTMSNENLEIKYFQIGDYPVIATGRDIEDVKAYVVKNNWPKELLKDIENG
ncbi:hypothetical protein BGI34_01315 [Snodgrassella alvi]|nr:hypothetical protein BGI34_01315 [Snodgrassella alvi]